jgi:FKBP-type peptidyl-prolyl cis-trans isomerase SlyD
MSQAVADGKVVTIHFTLSTEGEVADSTASGEPINYLHGADNIVPGLESALLGRAAGDKVNVSVAPENGYGARVDAPPMRVPRDQFPPDFPIQVGMPIGGEDANGNVIPFWITHVDAGSVVVDPNHPLAGKTLDFQVEIVAVRDASQDELDHGHPHGPGGAH